MPGVAYGCSNASTQVSAATVIFFACDDVSWRIALTPNLLETVTMSLSIRPLTFPVVFAFSFVVLLFASCDSSTLVGDGSSAARESSIGAEAPAVSAAQAEIDVLSSATTVASFDPTAGELPEGLAVDHKGNIYVGMSGLGEIWKLSPNGTFVEVFASFALNPEDQGVLGLRFDPRGNLYAGVVSTNTEVHGVWRIGPGGESERIEGSEAIAFPNDVTVSPNGILFITDSVLGAVWRSARGGEAQIWVQHETLEGTGDFGLGIPIGANGVAFTPGGKLSPVGTSRPGNGGLFVANSEKAQLVFVPILPGGSAGEPQVVAAEPGLFGLDGIALDARGTIYGAVNVANRIVRISQDGSTVSEVYAGAPLDFPASVAFGAAGDVHTLLVANFAIIHFLSDPPTPENANPAVISIEIGPPGRAH